MKRTFVTALAAAAAVVVAGIAYGAIPSANGTITGCVDSKGSLKLIDAESGAACGAGKQTLNWNQQGPAGPQGPQGATGPQGEPGPSNAYFASDLESAVAANTGYRTIATLSLPAGAYVISAKAQVFVTGVSGVTCELSAFNGSDLQNLLLSSTNNVDGVSLMLGVTSSQSFNATLKCMSGGAGATIQNARVAAIKVGSLTTQ